MNIHSLAIAASAFLIGPLAAAETGWPDRPVTIVVPNNPGSGSDLSARLVTDALSKAFGQPFVVENVPGAANTIGTAKVAAAPADGYTIVHASGSALVLAPLTRNDLAYTPDDFAPIGQTMASTNTLVVNSERMPFETLEELLAELKANPGKYNYSTSGIGGLSHLAHELLQATAGVQITHIPYSGAPEATAALVAGEVDLAIIQTPAALPFIESGQLRALAVASSERIEDLPDVPAIREVVPEFGGVSSWNGMLAPKGTDPAVIDKMSAAMVDYLGTQEGKDAMARIGAVATPSNAAGFSAMIAREIDVWRGVVERAGLRP